VNQSAGTHSHGVLDAHVTIPDHVVFRSFPNETVVLNLESGKYHGLNPTSGRMLEALRKTDVPRRAAMELATEFGQPIDRILNDLIGFISDLKRRGLIQIEDGGV